MEKTILAKAIKGREYVYSIASVHGVARAKAAEVCSVLNSLRWHLLPGEVWHVYTVDAYDAAYAVADLRRFIYHRGGGITETQKG